MQQSPDQNSARDWHALDAQAALEAQQSSAEGLDAAEAAARLQQHGYNRLPEPPKRSSLMSFLLQFHNALIYVLLAAPVRAIWHRSHFGNCATGPAGIPSNYP